jgi:hypothetical protein
MIHLLKCCRKEKTLIESNQNIDLDSKDTIDSSYIRQVKSVSGITVMAKSKWLNAIHVRGTQKNCVNH